MNSVARANILVVEDSLAAAKRLQTSLEQTGFFVEVARNGREAWTKAQRKQFDVVVTDEQMPIMSGRDLCRKLRDDHRYARTPVIFLTGSRTDLEQDGFTKDLNVAAILEKPFSPKVIVHLIENQLLAARGRPAP